MKGIVFTEFLDLVAERFGDEVMDRIIAESRLPSGAAYTAVGTYDHAELVALVGRLSRTANVPVPALLKAYGEHLFTRFAVRYPQFFAGITSSFDFLGQIEAHIHVEVRKLYPDAELPSIQTERTAPDMLTLTYRSVRPLAAFAEGLMMGAIAHFKETVTVDKVDASADGTYVRFVLARS